MVLTYCVKQRKKTASVPNSENYVTTKNGRTMLKSVCAECGARKSQFVKGKSGSGLILGKNSPFRNIPVLGAIL